jgi:trimeric autotransporter adhesin
VDLIVADNTDNTLSVLLNTTAPGSNAAAFATRQTFAAGNFLHSIVAADLNGDGRPDLIAVNDGDGNVSVLLNTTAPGASVAAFAPQATFATGFGPYTVAVNDMNGDGRPDLVVSNFSENTVSVMFNTTAPGASAPGFAAPANYAAGTAPSSAIAIDVNGDGNPDVIAVNDTSDTVTVLLNTRYRADVAGSPAVGTIVHDAIFADGFDD